MAQSNIKPPPPKIGGALGGYGAPQNAKPAAPKNNLFGDSDDDWKPVDKPKPAPAGRPQKKSMAFFDDDSD